MTAMRRRMKFGLGIGAGAVLAAGLFLWSKGSHDKVFEGVIEWNFEKSDFYLKGDCSASPYWYDGSSKPSANLYDRRKEIGNPRAMQVKFRGDLSRVGLYGHLNKYIREIHSTEIIEA